MWEMLRGFSVIRLDRGLCTSEAADKGRVEGGKRRNVKTYRG